MLGYSENYSALSRPRLIAGVGMQAIAFIWPLAVIVAIEVDSRAVQILAIVIAGLAHGILAWAYKADPEIFAVYRAYTDMGDLYQPWPRANLVRQRRPVGYGRNLRC
uniref:Type IV secretory pathway, VirB3-like protein n=1 Tax=mine drainage metagenome TaxID=410659 RepID=E6QMV5_9ZZZZ